jgi:hypothetical protein
LIFGYIRGCTGDVEGRLDGAAKVELQDGKAVRGRFIGMDSDMSAEACEIGEQIVRGKA